MRSHKVNEKGMTLVEILAALVILGIVFVGFMTIFPQMTNFNEKTGTKLETMNEARNLLHEFKTLYTLDEFEGNGYTESNGMWIKTMVGKTVNEKIEYRIQQAPSLEAGTKIEQSNLHFVEILIINNNKVKSKTFGYIEVLK
ncbi:type II secretion system GspH family protein [Sporosarcina luteola]|uniref:PulJ/GspJ family protein n=1 Tax=Sporosarcina luteola TaxID=582850 RepID=UPI00203B4D7E|nr:type II secretion system protein [Sporosarcina luteola]MCM3743490.1 type II secretion system GspH family protein [Sporosarcina luteola]